MLAFLVWDPSPEIFLLPWIHLPLTWYGLIFAVGFYAGFHLFVRLAKGVVPKAYCESLLAYIMVGTVVGARLGHLLFYEPWSLVVRDPLVIFRTWEGGLASHGGIAGVVIALILFYFRHGKKYPQLSFFRLFDLLSIPVMLVCSLIRIGNFFNQEICGVPTDLPWAIIFAHPADGALPLPRHPVQLYESLGYFFVFVTAWLLWRWKQKGVVAYCFIAAFTFRFFIEGFKEELSHLMQGDHLFLMGQYLSLPMIAFGCVLFYFSWFHKLADAKKI